jgi:hypothetical protein
VCACSAGDSTSARGAVVAVLAEEWHTAGFCLHLDATLRERPLRDRPLRDRCILLWNANNNVGFERIDWWRLSAAATLTTVSRYMKHLMWTGASTPWSSPTGSRPAPSSLSTARPWPPSATAPPPCLAVKVGRFSPDKRWHQAAFITRSLSRGACYQGVEAGSAGCATQPSGRAGGLEHVEAEAVDGPERPGAAQPVRRRRLGAPGQERGRQAVGVSPLEER